MGVGVDGMFVAGAGVGGMRVAVGVGGMGVAVGAGGMGVEVGTGVGVMGVTVGGGAAVELWMITMRGGASGSVPQATTAISAATTAASVHLIRPLLDS